MRYWVLRGFLPAIIVLLALYVPGPMQDPASAAPGPPADGDWVITGDEAVNGTDLTVKGTIIVKAGATLTLGNLSLKSEASAVWAYAVVVETGGRFVLDNSTAHLGPGFGAEYGSVLVKGDIVMADSAILGGYGIYVEDGSITMGYSAINGSAEFGLALSNSTANMTGCNLNANGWTGLFAMNSLVHMLGTNVFDNKGTGMYLADGSYVFVDRGWIGSNEGGGIFLEDAAVELVNTSVSNNKQSGINGADPLSKIFVTGGLITSNTEYGIISSMSELQLEGVSWSLPAGIPNGKGHICEVGDVTIHPVDARSGNPWYGAWVEMNGTGGPYGPETMSEEKLTFHGVISAFEDNNGVEHAADAFEVSCWDPNYPMDIGETTGGHLYDVWSEAGVTCNLSEPDLSIRVRNSDIGSVQEGDALTLEYELFNDWSKPLRNVTVFMDANIEGNWTMTMDELPPMKWTSVNITYDTEGKRGEHVLRAYVDPNSSFPELTRDNNDAGWKFKVVKRTVEWRTTAIASLAAVTLAVVGLVAYGWYWSRKSKARSAQERRKRMERREREEMRAREGGGADAGPSKAKTGNAPKRR